MAPKFKGQDLSWDEMIELLLELFSVDKDEVNVEEVEEVLAAYKSDPRDWKRFAKFDKYKYTRNLVHEGNGKFNLMLLCWAEGNQSSIHDHADAHCFVKVLDGGLREVGGALRMIAFECSCCLRYKGSRKVYEKSAFDNLRELLQMISL